MYARFSLADTDGRYRFFYRNPAHSSLTQHRLDGYTGLPGGFTPYLDGAQDDASIVLGINGEFDSGMSYDFSYNYGKNELDYFLNNTVNGDLPLVGVCPDCEISQMGFDVGGYAQEETNINADFGLPLSDNVFMAFGLEIREEVFTAFAGEATSFEGGGSSGFRGVEPANAGDFKRDNTAFYADIEHDITDRFLLQYAARYENFSDFGSTLNGKLAARFRISDGFALRGAVSTGFHAPTPGQANVSTIITTFDSGVQVEEGLGQTVGQRSFAPDFEWTARGEDEGSSFAHHCGEDATRPLTRAHTDLRPVGFEIRIVEVEVAGAVREPFARDRIRERREHSVGVEVGQVARGCARADLVGALQLGERVEQDVGEVHHPVGDLAAPVPPPAAPLALNHVGAAGLVPRAVEPQVVVEAGGAARLDRPACRRRSNDRPARAPPPKATCTSITLPSAPRLRRSTAARRAGGLDPLGAGLRDQLRAGQHGLVEDLQLLQLVDQRLLTVEVLAAGQGERHDAAVRVVGGGDDDGVELTAVLVEGLAVVRAGESAGVLLGGKFQGAGVHVAQADDLGQRVLVHGAAIGLADRADHADREHVQLGVRLEPKPAGARRQPSRPGPGPWWNGGSRGASSCSFPSVLSSVAS